MTVLCIFPIKSSNKKGEPTTKQLRVTASSIRLASTEACFLFVVIITPFFARRILIGPQSDTDVSDTDYSASSFFLSSSLVFFTVFSEYKLSSLGVIGFSKVSLIVLSRAWESLPSIPANAGFILKDDWGEFLPDYQRPCSLAWAVKLASTLFWAQIFVINRPRILMT